jgi:hypothetical protein
MSDDKRNLYQRLAAAILDIPPIEKDTSIEVKQGQSYRATTYDGAITKIRPVLLRHGIVFSQEVLESTNDSYEYETKYGQKVGFLTYVRVRLTFINVDNPDERIVSDGVGTGMDSQDKAAGKALTYARKTALFGILMTSTGDNEESRPDHEATRTAPRPEKRPQAQGSSEFATEPQTKLVNIKGKNVFGDAWEAKKAETLGHYGVTSTKELTFDQASKIIDRLVKLEEEMSLDDMGV